MLRLDDAALQEAKDAISSRIRGSLSFLQLQHQSFKTVPESSVAAMAAARAVRRLAVRVDSPSLIELAGRLDYVAKDRFGSSADALNRVRGLIEDMIGRLQSEAHAEADHQAFCDKEMSVASVKRDDKQSDVDRLSTKMEEARSELTLLSQQSSRLRQELADLAQSVVELDKVRQEEKVLFEKAHKDTQEGLEGLRVALQVLRTFYAKIGGTGRSGHAVSTLEFAASEMRKRAVELEARESQAASEYTRITTDNGVMQASKQHEAEARTADVSALQKLLNELSSDHAAAKEELDALQDFTAKLQDQCVAKPEPYEERKQRRENEINGLKEALAALDGSKQMQVGSSTSVNTVFLQLRGSVFQAAQHGHEPVEKHAMAYRSLSSAHPLAFCTGASSSGEQPQPLLLEQSPARSKAPSDPPSDFSSWHDDASSSLAPSGTARDGTITVNPLVMRMGEHLKGKLQGMIRQRFENYIHITKSEQQATSPPCHKWFDSLAFSFLPVLRMPLPTVYKALQMYFQHRQVPSVDEIGKLLRSALKKLALLHGPQAEASAGDVEADGTSIREDIIRLLGSCNLFAGLSWKAEASNVLPSKGAAPVVRWPTRRARLKAEAGDRPLLRQKGGDEERDRWIKFLAVPISLDFSSAGELGRSRRVGKGRRSSTLRKHMKTWEKFIMWLQGAYGELWPWAPYQFTDYLEERASEPCGRSVPLSLLKTLMVMEASAELPKEQQLSSHPAVSNAMHEVTRFLESATPLTMHKADMLPVKLVVMLEHAVVHGGGSRFARALAWYKLVKVWGALRHSDAQGVDVSSMTLQDRGLEATLLRTKTSGPGKPIKSLQFYVSKDCWIDEPRWLQIGWELWQALGKEAGLAEQGFLVASSGELAGIIDEKGSILC
eukprot:s905_g1.t1